MIECFISAQTRGRIAVLDAVMPYVGDPAPGFDKVRIYESFSHRINKSFIFDGFGGRFCTSSIKDQYCPISGTLLGE